MAELIALVVIVFVGAFATVIYKSIEYKSGVRKQELKQAKREAMLAQKALREIAAGLEPIASNIAGIALYDMYKSNELESK